MPRPAAPGPDPLFSLAPGGFAWATGIEDTFIGQTERIGERVLDEYALTHHYLYWREDIDRAVQLGVRAMRYGIPWYKVEPAPGVFDWSWADRVLEYIADQGITIIVDLLHYGTPLWLDNQFLNAGYPQRVAAYAAEFTRRYRHLVSHYTPLNEPRITIAFTGQHGIWPPYLHGDDGAVKILRALTRGIALSIAAIRAEDPRAVIVGVEAAGEVVPATPALADLAGLATARTFLATDLVTGRVAAGHLLLPWLCEHGMPEAELAWHCEHPAEMDIIGVNYYPENSVTRLREGNGQPAQEARWGGAAGLERAVAGFAARYARPVMITETSTNGPLELRARWLAESVATIPRLRGAGVPLVGYTWWPLFDLIDWSYRHSARPLEEFIARLGPQTLDPAQLGAMLTTMRWTRLEQLPLEAYLAPMGLYALQMQFDGTFARVATALVAAYQEIVAGDPANVGEIRPRAAGA
jgi:beta-glucosidase